MMTTLGKTWEAARSCDHWLTVTAPSVMIAGVWQKRFIVNLATTYCDTKRLATTKYSAQFDHNLNLPKSSIFDSH